MGNTFCCSCSPSQEQNEIAASTMPEVPSMQDIDQLIDYIDQIISKIERRGQECILKPPSVVSLIDFGGNLIENLSKRFNLQVCKKCLLCALHRETSKIVIDVLKDAELIPYLGMALSVIAHLLERAETASSNRSECLRLLGYMSTLAKRMKNLDVYSQRDQLNDIVIFIVEGTLICVRLMEPNTFCRFVFAPVDVDDLEKLKSALLFKYSDLALQVGTEALQVGTEALQVGTAASQIGTEAHQLATAAQEVATAVSDRQPKYLDASQGEYPPDAVSIEEAQYRVTELLDLKDSAPRVVVIYGVGGIGKTTLATAVFSSLDLTSYHHCRVDMEKDCKERDLKAMQEQILRDLSKENLQLSNYTEGRETLSKALGKASKPIFLFIDNALKKADLEILLPIEHLSRLPVQSRILLTTRNLDETRMQHGIQFHSYRVDSVPKAEAKKVLCHYALGDKNDSFDPAVNMDGLLQICAGIPLVLRIVGAKLCSDGNSVSACNEILEYYKEWEEKGLEGGEGDVSECMVDSVYRRLMEPSREAFLDIVFFFYGWERSDVSDIVGETQLRDLESAALVTTYEEEEDKVCHWDWRWGLDLGVAKAKTKVRVRVHDIVKARGIKLAEGNRIRDRESLSLLLNDPQKLQQTKGIWLGRDREELILEAKHLDLMSGSLRVLYLGRRMRVNGRCESAFKDLKFLSINHDDVLPIDLSQSRRLTFFQGCLMEGDRNSEAKLTMNLPPSLRLLYCYGGEPPVSLHINGDLPSLRKLRLSSFNIIENLGRFGNFTSLQTLQMIDCSELQGLPETFGNLSSLQDLDVNGCGKLERLPQSIGNLSSLQYLNTSSCPMLESLPESFGNLFSIRDLNMQCCDKLRTLPESFENLSSLQYLNVNECSLERLPHSIGNFPLKKLEMSLCEMERLPDSFDNLSSLQYLFMSHCSKLEKLSDNFGNLSSLQTLSMDECPKLEKLPDSFGNLSSLQTLSMVECPKLEKLPDSFGNLSSLQTLNMHGCSKLEKLPDNFGSLSSLQILYIRECSMLERLPQTFGQMSFLQELVMKNCTKLCSLSDNFGQLKCLKYLSIGNCKELKELPDDIVSWTSLVAMKAQGCTALEAKAMDNLVEIKSLMFLKIGESPMLIKRWEQIQQHCPPIGAALRFPYMKYPYEEIMSTMFFNDGSRLVHIDGEGQLGEVERFPDVGMQVGLVLTACPLSEEVKEKVAASELQIMYVDVGVEGSNWMEERKKRISEMLVRLPQGSLAWTNPSYKTTLLFAYSIFRFIEDAWLKDGGFDRWIMCTNVGRRKLSQPWGLPCGRDACDSRHLFSTLLELKTLFFFPLEEAWDWMYDPKGRG